MSDISVGAEDSGNDGDVQELVDRLTKELMLMKEHVASLSSHVAELEEDLDTARKDLIKSEDINSRLQRDIREVRSVDFIYHYLRMMVSTRRVFLRRSLRRKTWRRESPHWRRGTCPLRGRPHLSMITMINWRMRWPTKILSSVRSA